MRILISSPVPTAPLNHGNRARVHSFAKELQERGHEIHMVYTGFEGLTLEQEMTMRQDFEALYVLSAKPKRHKPLFRHHHIDSWYPNSLDQLMARLLSTWRYDACIANYVWCSRWLNLVPQGIPKYIDTHDRFANRHARLKKDGMEANWFSTSKRQEAKALRRADRVFAIQKTEALHFQSLTSRPVDVIGHRVKRDFQSVKPIDQYIKLGYLASDNPMNRYAVKVLSGLLADEPNLLKHAELHLAGPVSLTDEAASIPDAICHGFVASPSVFYSDMDVILNPHVGGTGLKIKSIEALAFGKPLIATTAAMEGIDVDADYHRCETVENFCKYLAGIVSKAIKDPVFLESLAKESRRVFDRYEAARTKPLDRLFASPLRES